MSEATPMPSPQPPADGYPLSRVLGVAFAIWTLIGVLSIAAGAGSVMLAGAPVPWGRTIAHNLISVWLWVGYTPLIFAAAARWPLLSRARQAGHYGAHLGLLLVLNAVEASLLSLVLAQLGLPSGVSALASRFLSILVLNLISYGVLAAIGNARLAFAQLREEEARAARLSSELATAQLSALRAQLHPHFLFNTLNAVAELIHKSPDSADRMLTRLGAFLRRSLDTSDRHEVSLEEELESLEAYLDVIRLRFGSRLSVELAIGAEALSAQVPTLVLQPLVENAIKHGLEPKEGAGRLEVRAHTEGSTLRLEVRDDGVGIALGGGGRSGVGLRNTRERLNQLYGPSSAFSLEPGPSGGAIARVSLPFHTAGGAR